VKAAAVLLLLAFVVAGAWLYLNGARAFGLSLACAAAAWALAKLLSKGA
jgi:hypothetical protein